jgi:hypothetical protein
MKFVHNRALSGLKNYLSLLLFVTYLIPSERKYRLY